MLSGHRGVEVIPLSGFVDGVDVAVTPDHLVDLMGLEPELGAVAGAAVAWHETAERSGRSPAPEAPGVPRHRRLALA